MVGTQQDVTGVSPSAASPVARPAAARRLRVLIYALVLASSCLQMSLPPLLPSYAHRFGLSGFDQGMLLAATGLATLAVSVPAGMLADRLGARRLTLFSGWLMALAVLGQAVAPTFLVLLASRLVFGIGYGIVWTAGLAWLAGASESKGALGGTVASSGVGGMIGPAFAGFLAQYLGLAAPFVVAAVLFAMVTVGLTRIHSPAHRSADRSPFAASLRVAVADRRTLGATAAIVVASLTSGVTYLLAPGELHAAGASAGTIGLVFSAAAVLFIGGSTATTWAGRRAVRLFTVLAASLVLAIAISPAVLSVTPVAVIAMICATTAARSVLWTVGYPLGAAGAEASGIGLGVVMGLLNGVWALATVASPLFAGALVGTVSTRGIFGLTQLVSIAILVSVWLRIRRDRRPPQAMLEPIATLALPASETVAA